MFKLTKISASNILFICISIILLTFGISTFINATFLIFNYKVSSIAIYTAHVSSIVIINYLIKHKVNILLALLFFYIILLSSYSISINTYDVSWDGQWYHQDAIIKLLHGWNPFYSEPLNNYSTSESEMWIQHYPQASWYLQASMLEITDKIQSTKQISIVLAFTVLLLSYFTLIKIIKIKSKIVSILISICISLNPVVCYQINSFYVDGQSAMLLTIYILLLINLYYHKSTLLFLLLGVTFVYVCNIKFTNLVYVSVFTFFYYLLDLIRKKRLNYKLSIYFIIIYILTIFYVGYGSYGRNIIEKSHPFYPLMGKNNFGKVVSDVNKSDNFIDKNRFENFILSNFSYPKYSRQPYNSELRIPFTKTEYFQYSRTDAEIAGFGAIYSDLIIIILLSSILPIYKLIKKNNNKYIIAVLIFTIIFSVIINSEMFVARYIPQLFLVPIILLIITFLTEIKILKFISILLFLGLIMNSYYILERQYYHQKEVNNVIEQEIKHLRSLKQPINIRNRYLSLERRLYENNISFINDRNNPSQERREFVYTYYENYYFEK